MLLFSQNLLYFRPFTSFAFHDSLYLTSALLCDVIRRSLTVCLSVCLSVTLWYNFNKKQTYDDAVFTKCQAKDSSFRRCKQMLPEFEGYQPREIMLYRQPTHILVFGKLRKTNEIAQLQATCEQLSAGCCNNSLANRMARSRLRTNSAA